MQDHEATGVITEPQRVRDCVMLLGAVATLGGIAMLFVVAFILGK
jgi:hypothetical protein